MIAAQHTEIASMVHNGGSADVTIDIGRDFSQTPGGRYVAHGPFSGEAFRRELLVDAMERAIQNDFVVRVILDTVKRSYLSSFLDEAFAGLVRDEGMSKADVQAHLSLVATQPRFLKYKALAEKYLQEA